MSYLLQWFDGALQPRPDDTPTRIAQEELDRLARLQAVASIAAGMPRRLGSDATPEELGTDRRRAKRVAHAAANLVTAWGGQPGAGMTTDLSRAAAQVDWERWWQQHEVFLVNRRRYIATWGLKNGQQCEKWAKSAIVRINNELSWMAYALRP